MDAVDIAIDGDAILICGIGDYELGLRVCSAILSRTSPVFKALLSPHLQEGTELSEIGTVEILLSDDDAAAMKTICHVLHFRYQNITFEPPQGQLGRIAIIAEKYDLAKALKPMAHIWISHVLQNSNQEQWETSLIIS